MRTLFIFAVAKHSGRLDQGAVSEDNLPTSTAKYYRAQVIPIDIGFSST